MAFNAATIDAMYRAAGMAAPSGAARNYYLGKGASGEALLRSNLAKDRRSSTYIETDPTKRFINSIRDLLPKQAASITPFDQSGFYSDEDTKTLAEQEYAPYFAQQRQYADRFNREEDRQRLEQVAAAGGYRSSAFQNERMLRQAALERAAAAMSDEERAAKEQFRLNRRNDAFQRYVTATGALTAT
jgi:hypothetical protein